MKSEASYVFSLKYSPDLKKYDIHGLWPQIKEEKPLKKQDYDLHQLLDTEDKILKKLPLIWNSDMHKKIDISKPEQEYTNSILREANVKFWTHEWDKHGKISPWECETYFKVAISLYYQFKPALPKVDLHHQIRIELDKDLKKIGTEQILLSHL